MRGEKFSREACANTVGGAKSCSPAMSSAPSACLDSFRCFMESVTISWRATGSCA